LGLTIGGWKTAAPLSTGRSGGAVEQHDGGGSQRGGTIKTKIFVEAEEGLRAAAGDGALGFSFGALAEVTEVASVAISDGLH
jgi:hypothetical protein